MSIGTMKKRDTAILEPRFMFVTFYTGNKTLYSLCSNMDVQQNRARSSNEEKNHLLLPATERDFTAERIKSNLWNNYGVCTLETASYPS